MLVAVLVACVQAQECVVFVRENAGLRHGALIHLERGHERVLVAASASMPTLSPDGRSVAFLNHAGTDSYPALALMDIQSGTQRTLAKRMPPQAVGFSPDSSSLVFAGWEESMVAEIYSVPCAGGTPKRLTSTTGRSPVFSPDGAFIAFMGVGTEGLHGLCLMRSDGTEMRQLASAKARDSRPDFSADGRWLVFQDYEDVDDKTLRGVVHVVDRESGDTRRISAADESACGGRFLADGRVILGAHPPEGARVVSVVPPNESSQAGSVAVLAAGTACSAVPSPQRVRARDIGIPFVGEPGPWNAITDVPGVCVGFSTIISDAAADAAGQVARTGVTAIFPRGRNTLQDPVMAGTCVLNGNGEVTGTAWLQESGFMEGPILLTNTHSVGTVRDATIRWRLRAGPPDASGSSWSLPVVAETWDGTLNDIDAFHVHDTHVFAALDAAQSGALAEGNVGGGTGMHTHRWKGGTGTASRRVGAHTVGVLVQSNYGRAAQLTVAGVPVGAELLPPDESKKENGSIIVVVATDAPLLPHQLERVARRAPLGIARMGSYAGNSSGDFMVAFSTANAGTAFGEGPHSALFLGNEALDPIFLATVEAVEEAICNALIAAETMSGKGGATLHALPHEKLRDILKKHGRLAR